jgi:hypothetical protein
MLQEAKRKVAEREQKKADVRKRLEEAGKKGKKKKGFLTPERKKKLRKLLMMKAADNLKNQQKQMESERQNVLSKRLVPPPNVDNVEDKGVSSSLSIDRYHLLKPKKTIITILRLGQLEKIYNDLFARMIKLEEEKYDVNAVVSQKDSEVTSHLYIHTIFFIS